MLFPLTALYKEMSEFTGPVCASGQLECQQFAGRPHRCCEARYCEQTATFAREKYGVDLPRTDHPIPFMGPNGCTVPPHLRPLCTLHLCSISWADRSTVLNDAVKTAEYFRLRAKIIEEARTQGKEPL